MSNLTIHDVFIFVIVMTLSSITHAVNVIPESARNHVVIGKCSSSEKIFKGEGFIYFLGQRDLKTNAVNLETVKVVSEIAVKDEDLAKDFSNCSYPNFDEHSGFSIMPAKVNRNGWEALWNHPLRGNESSGHLHLGAISLETGITNSTWSGVVSSYAHCAFGLNLNK